MRPVPIGVDDFRVVREQGMEYVDKSRLIQEVIDQGAQAILLPRPRRFGKTLNLSMLRCFFEKRGEDLSGLFEGLYIDSAGERYRAHFQRYPVIHLTFKGAKHERFEDCLGAIRLKIRVLFDEHRFVLASGRLSEREAHAYRAVLEDTAEPALYSRALLDLSSYLHRVHGQKVVLLIDEYDEPIYAGHVHGYAPAILGVLHAVLTEGLKDNPHLYKAVVTGILRIARESIFSGLNNLAVYSLLRRPFNAAFGFTEEEVHALLKRSNADDNIDAVRRWYNGYVFGKTVVYNPWSILNYIADEERLLRPHWLSTSSNDLIRKELQQHAFRIQEAIEALLQGGSIERALDEHVALGDLEKREGALWSLLVFSGYLKAEPAEGIPGEEPPYRLSIPNREVRQIYTSTFREWMEEQLSRRGGDIRRLTKALFTGDAEVLEEQLQAFTANVLSYHDIALRPEQVYHAFVIGLLAALEPTYLVRSNRESGEGRPDVLILPQTTGKPGAVLELKVARAGKKTPEQALAEGVAQIREGNYGAELSAAGASPVHAFAVAFDGKRVWVKQADLSAEA
jgi:hypothetical protein